MVPIHRTGHGRRAQRHGTCAVTGGERVAERCNVDAHQLHLRGQVATAEGSEARGISIRAQLETYKSGKAYRDTRYR